MSLAIRLGPGEFASCVFAASGCAGTGADLAGVTDLAGLGAVVTRSITAEPRLGHPPARLVETPAGLVNALGLPGPGIDGFLATELPQLVATGAGVVVSLWAEDAATFGKLAQRLRQAPGVRGIEVNLSSPGAPSVDAAAAVHQVRRNTAADVPVIAKLGPEAVVATARSCAGAGADAVALINAVPAVPFVDGRPALGAVVGGLSGPAIRPVALRAVWQVADALPQLPIVASGGIASGADAYDALAAGATAVAVGTALLSDPDAGLRITTELTRRLDGRAPAAVRGIAVAQPPGRTP